MAIAGSEFFFIGKDKQQFSSPPNIFRRIQHKVVHVYRHIQPIQRLPTYIKKFQTVSGIFKYRKPRFPIWLTKIIPSYRTFQIIPGMVPVIPFWVSSFPSRVPLSCSKYAYYPPNLWILTHFWGIITKFSQIFCPLFCPFNEYKNCCISTFCA